MDEREIVCVVDDDEGVRRSVYFLLASLGLTVKSYADGRDFLSDPQIRECGCLVTEVRMPGISGLELQIRLIRQELRIPVIFITGHGDVPMAVQAMRNGAIDFLPKPFNHQVLVDKVQQALDTSKEIRRESEQYEAVLARLAALSRRERQVLDLIVAGKMNKVIAAELGISLKTVESHRASVMEKMNAGSLVELVQQMSLVSR
ncbi:MAG TPA: response regulator transcription factor [Rhodocyclaceae bacterium]|nr:response regulator transcription factor [Rhodocyclaceae bacterium]